MRTLKLKVVVDESIFLYWERNKLSQVECESYGSGIQVINLGRNFRSGDPAAPSTTLKNHLGQACMPKIVKFLRQLPRDILYDFILELG